MARHSASVFVAVLLLVPTPAARAAWPGGVGVLGDSYSDEYQFYPPDRSTARNWVEILAETRGVDFGRFTTVSRGEPRNQGYEYNWARSDATTDSLIATGQHTGLAAQVAEGRVKLVYVFIGGNDFINAMYARDPAGALESVLPRALANYRLAVRTVLDASPDVKVVLATLPDIRLLPEFAGPIRDGRIPGPLADRFTAAMRTFNAQVRTIAAGEPRAALIDHELSARIAERLTPNRMVVAGRFLDRRTPSNAIDHFFLGDVRHPGTLGQSLMAKMFIETVDARFGAGIKPLGDHELLDLAVAAASSAKRDTVVRLAGFEAVASPPASAAPVGRRDGAATGVVAAPPMGH